MKSLLVKWVAFLAVMGFAIFGYAETSKAECAWVLWQSQYFADERTGAWTIDSAFPNYELCMKELNRNLETIKKGFEATSRAKINSFDYGFSVDVKDESGKENHFQFYLSVCQTQLTQENKRR
jgi:hypothetical protein